MIEIKAARGPLAHRAGINLSGVPDMLGFIGDHFFYIPLAGVVIFMATMIGVSLEDALRRP